jgi:magnesium-transporting ATPase (P-type)
MTSGPEYPGYAPAPSAPQDQGPPPMERPLVVRAGLGAFVAELILWVIELAVELTDFDGFVQRAVSGLADKPELTDEMLRTAGWLTVVVLALVAALQALFIWFAWQGRNWARIVLCVVGGMAAVGLLSAVGAQDGRTAFAASVDVFRLLLNVVGFALLLQKPAQAWYRDRRRQRAGG